MIVLYILGGLAFLIIVALFLPLTVSLDFKEELTYKIKLAFFKVYPGKEKANQTPQEENTSKESSASQKGFFTKLKEKRGFVGAVKEIFSFLKDCLPTFKKFLRFVKFDKVRVDITVASEDAAKTAIDYGIVCSATYPVLAFVDSIANVRYKKIDVKTDFESKKSSLSFSLSIKTQVIYILILAFGIFKEYQKFSVRNDLQ